MFLIYCIDEQNNTTSFTSRAFLEPGIKLNDSLTIVDVELLDNYYDESIRY